MCAHFRSFSLTRFIASTLTFDWSRSSANHECVCTVYISNATFQVYWSRSAANFESDLILEKHFENVLASAVFSCVCGCAHANANDQQQHRVKLKSGCFNMLYTTKQDSEHIYVWCIYIYLPTSIPCRWLLYCASKLPLLAYVCAMFRMACTCV